MPLQKTFSGVEATMAPMRNTHLDRLVINNGSTRFFFSVDAPTRLRLTPEVTEFPLAEIG